MRGAYFVRDFFRRDAETLRAASRTSRSVSSSPAIPSRSWMVPRSGVPFWRQKIASLRTASLGSRAASSLSSGRNALTSHGWSVDRERRAAIARALVLEAAAQQLELLAEPELRDRAIRDAAHAIVGVPRRRLELVVPLAPKCGERALIAGGRERIRLFGSLRERHAGWSERGTGPT
jgi:hypothetical protein